MKKFRSGAASFYIVAIATLLFSVIAISFATLVVSEIRRTSDSDLSQSAYDSALAGIEDAKSAYLSYQSCINQGYTSSDTNACGKIIAYMENPDCDMVTKILGRAQSDNGEVLIEESTGSNAMEQAYTCVKIIQNLSDYRSTLNSANPSRLVKASLNSISADEITSIRLSWYSDTDGTTYNFTNFSNGAVTFPLRSTVLSTPPTISIQLIQTAVSFNLDDFEKTVGEQTDRGTLFLVPTSDSGVAARNSTTYLAAYSGEKSFNVLSKTAFLKSNDKTVQNLPYAVYCSEDSSAEFACSVSIEIPKPIGDGSRSSDTFAFIVSLPYGGPDTDFSLAFCTGSGVCASADSVESGVTVAKTQEISGGQIKIDSTGRANDLFRRVEARIDTYDSNYSYPEYAIELLGEGTVLTKTITPTSEYNFGL